MGTIMKTNHAIAITVLAATMFSGCASPGPGYTPVSSQPYPSASQPYPMPSQSYSTSYGVVDSIRVTQGDSNGNGMGAGAVVGGVVGGLLGHQVGGGRGKTAATVAGTIGGAMVGNQMQRNAASVRDMYQIGVRLDNGGYQTFTQDSMAGLQVGSRVRVENERVYRY
jgi:outer membrane lipoprotein SlyB